MGIIKDKSTFRLIISAVIVVGLFVTAFVGAEILKALEWGPTPIYILSPRYAVVRNTLCVVDPNKFDPGIVTITRILNSTIEESVNAFYVESNWILGKTDIGYFAVDISKDKMNYPLESLEKITELTGLAVNPNDWIDSHEKRMNSKYLYRRQSVKVYGKIWNYTFSILIPIFCILCFWWSIRRKNLLNS
jgi:hypothetical protein